MKLTEEAIIAKFNELSRYQDFDNNEFPVLTIDENAGVELVQWAISQMQMDWVAVTPETKPESGKHYFALIKAMNGKFIKCVAAYTEGWDLEVDSEGDEDHLNHSEENSMSYMPKGWYESCEQQGGSYDEVYFKRDVVYYLPSIELPKPATK